MESTVPQSARAVNGYIFACSNKTEQECLDRKLFSASRIYGDDVLKIKKGDLLFLFNINSDTLIGTFEASSDGGKSIVPEAWGGKYPYQVRAKKRGMIHYVKGARKIFSISGINWRNALSPQIAISLSDYVENPSIGNLKLSKSDQDEKPKLESTTLWDYPNQSYGKIPKGSNKYAGVTPAFLIYNLLKRYTEPGDLVLDPMAGSGTTLDVCNEECRKCIAYDISPSRKEILPNDARIIPLEQGSIDMIFIDSPYGDNIDYNDKPGNLGKISAETDEFYDELEKVMIECYRVLKPGRVLAWLIGDQWAKKRFTPVGFRTYQKLTKHFETVDIICVTRRGQTSNRADWHTRALRFNFYLRGFKYLFIMRKSDGQQLEQKKASWKQYPRN